MSKWVHRLVFIDPDKKRGVCIACGEVELRAKYCFVSKKTGEVKISWRCVPGLRKGEQSKSRSNRPVRNGRMYGSYIKLDYCELCGFVAEDSCQLDVDHKDSDKYNANVDNLWTLCANCHRLVTRRRRKID
jgi:hypothetical protein